MSIQFLEQTKTHYDRVVKAAKLKKSLKDICKLCSYYDLKRLSSLNTLSVKTLMQKGIYSVEEITLIPFVEFKKHLEDSNAEGGYFFERKKIREIYSEASETPIIVFNLHKEYIKQHTSYAKSRNEIYKGYKYVTESSKTEFVVFLLTIFSCISLSFVSVYFLALIPIVLGYYLFKNPYFVQRGTYKIKKFLSDRHLLHKNSYLRYIYSLQRSFATLGILIGGSIFVIGLQSGSVGTQFASIGNIWQATATEQDSFTNKGYGEPMTRGELIGVLMKSKNVDIPDYKEASCFEDISESLFKNEICYAKYKGYISGDAYNNFNTDTIITHGAAMKFILNSYEHDVPRRAAYISYDDLERSQWQTGYAEYAKKIGIIPESTTKFGADEPFTDSMLYRYLGVLQN